MNDPLLSHLGKIAHYIPGVFLRWYYTEEKLARKISVSVRGDGEGVYFHHGTPGSVRIWLTVSNFLPFDVEVDRITGSVSCGHKVAELAWMEREKIGGSSQRELLVETTLSSDQLQAVARFCGERDSTRLTLNLQFDCKIRRFRCQRGELRVKNVEFAGFAKPS